MDKQQIGSALGLYKGYFTQHGIKKEKIPKHQSPFNDDESLKHLHMMLDEFVGERIREDDELIWFLGFLQGVFWNMRIFNMNNIEIQKRLT